MRKRENNDLLKKLTEMCLANDKFNADLYTKYDVKRGLRDINGNGVVAGLTDVSDVVAKKKVGDEIVPCEGELYYRGINIFDIVKASIKGKRFNFEEVIYLLLFNKLPNTNELNEFSKKLAEMRVLPKNFVRDVILKAPSYDMINNMSKSILTLYSYDDNPNDTSIENVLKQSLKLITLMPLLAVYAYQAHNHYNNKQSLIIHTPDENLSIAENILHLIRPDSSFSELEARVLDISLILHAEHGGGNNSTFTTHVVTSSGTDTYSAVTAALCSLKGPKHGGANIKVVQMFEDIKSNVHNWGSRSEVKKYVEKILDGKAFDGSGLVYGMGHAVYSVSDPRAVVFKNFVEKLSGEKNLADEFNLYNTVEEVAVELISEKRKIYKGVSANVDFYSGFAYRMLGLPQEIFTPMFAVARIAGWSAHRIEELINGAKIIRPAYKSVSEKKKFLPIELRK